MGVTAWEDPAPAVTGSAAVVSSNMAAVQDLRLSCTPRAGAYQVLAWEDPATTVTGASDVHAQGAALWPIPACPTRQSGAWIIIAEDGTWLRPLPRSTLAVLQGLPTPFDDGTPLTRAGRSQARWRERTGNAVPIGAAEAIGRTRLLTLIPARLTVFAIMCGKRPCGSAPCGRSYRP